MLNGNLDVNALAGALGLTNVLSVFDAMHDGIMIIDKDYRIQYYNKAMEKIEGFKSEEVIGKLLLDVFPFQTYEKNSIMQAIQEGTQVIDNIQSYITSKGRQITVVTSTIPIKSKDRIIGALEITKDISSARTLVEKILELQDKLNKAQIDNYNQKYKANGCRYCFEEIIGKSSSIIKAIEHAKKASFTNSTVLIRGETGTGKEMFVQSIHNKSLRRDKPFVAVNCAAVPGELLESILFGTVKGGFTGSIDRPGLFEQANGGTLLLDEIDSMDPGLQAKLLRALQEGYVRRVGATTNTKLDIRLISTTNSNLTEAMEEGSFRKDLFYRLSVVNIIIPPLRERDEDIIILANHFIKEFNHLFSKNVEGLSPEVIDLFKGYFWPGNIRELKHCIEGIMNIVEDERFIKFDLAPPRITKNCSVEQKIYSIHKPIGTLNSITDAVEKKSIMKALVNSKGNVSKAAISLGIKRQALQYKMKKHGISKDNFTIYWNDIW